jgi:hypothetical protein
MMLRLGCAWYCAILLFLSGTQHAANPYLFFGSILDYQLVPMQMAVLIAAILPWLHLILAALLIAPRMTLRSPFVATAMLGVLFVVVQLTVIVRGIPVDCGCFGAVVSDRQVGVASLCLAGSLTLAALIGAYWTRTAVATDALPMPEAAT